MINIFGKNIKKEIKSFFKHVRHVSIRDDDILSERIKDKLAVMVGEAKQLHDNYSKNKETTKVDLDNLKKNFEAVVPPKNWKFVREYAEIFIVALTVAFGVRALFVQPFKIPTSSMQPTLFGIHYVEKDVIPSFPQPLNFALFSAQRAKLQIERSGYLEYVYPPSSKFLFPYTSFNIGGIKYEMPGSPTNIADYVFKKGSTSRSLFDSGQTICNGWLSQGDHLFVDRFSYHFIPPKRGDIVIFTTENLHEDSTGEGLTDHGLYYVKRLVGMPGDTMKIDRNGMLLIKTKESISFEPITDFGEVFKRIYSGKGGYQGYWPVGRLAEGKEVVVPKDHYFMLGDNTSVSSDGRFWGFVPRSNIVGKPLFVFWPLSRRWGVTDIKKPIEVSTTYGVNNYIPQMELQ